MCIKRLCWDEIIPEDIHKPLWFKWIQTSEGAKIATPNIIIRDNSTKSYCVVGKFEKVGCCPIYLLQDKKTLKRKYFSGQVCRKGNIRVFQSAQNVLNHLDARELKLFNTVKDDCIHLLPISSYRNGQKIAGATITNEIQNDKRF